MYETEEKLNSTENDLATLSNKLHKTEENLESSKNDLVKTSHKLQQIEETLESTKKDLFDTSKDRDFQKNLVEKHIATNHTLLNQAETLINVAQQSNIKVCNQFSASN